MGMSTYVVGLRKQGDPKQADEVEIEDTDAVTEWVDNGTHRAGFEVELAKLPEGVTHVRFYNVY